MTGSSSGALTGGGIFLAALGFRAFGLESQSLSMDELAELGISRHGIGEILWMKDGFPPLYHLLLRGWIGLFGTEAAARWLSVLLGSLAVVAVWGLARRAAGSRVAVCAGLLMALSPFHTWHAQEARAYVLYVLLAALAFWSFLTAVQTGSRRAWGAYVVSVVGGMLTHYYFALLAASAALIYLTSYRHRAGWKVPLLAHGVLTVALLPVVPLLAGDLSSEAGVPFPNRFQPAALGYTFFTFVAGYALGPSTRELHVLRASDAIRELLPWLVAITAGAGILTWHGLRRLPTKEWICWLAFGTVLPVVASIALAATVGVTFQVRHVVWASIPLLVIVGAGAAEAPARRSAAVGVLILVVVALVSRYHRHADPRYQNEDARALAGYLESTGSAVPVLVLTGYMSNPVRHYLSDSWSVHAIPNSVVRPGDLSAARAFLESILPRNAPFWLVYTREFHGDPDGEVLGALLRGSSLALHQEFAGIRLYRGAATPALLDGLAPPAGEPGSRESGSERRPRTPPMVPLTPPT